MTKRTALTGQEKRKGRVSPAMSRYKREVDGRMNKTELAFAEWLENRRFENIIHWWMFEQVKIRLADNTFYTPDFYVCDRGGLLTFYEVKGFWHEDARVKFKVAAEQHRWVRFVAVKRLPKKRGGGWEFEERR